VIWIEGIEEEIDGEWSSGAVVVRSGARMPKHVDYEAQGDFARGPGKGMLANERARGRWGRGLRTNGED
jgi:hypothetical protein